MTLFLKDIIEYVGSFSEFAIWKPQVFSNREYYIFYQEERTNYIFTMQTPQTLIPFSFWEGKKTKTHVVLSYSTSDF